MENCWILILEIALLILLIAGSAFFSSAEMSLFSLSHAKVSSYRDSSSSVERLIHFLMEDYSRTLTTIILSNMFVNSCISMLNDHLIRMTGLTGTCTTVLSGFIAIVVLLLFGEITPMTLAYVHCEKWSRIAARPVAVLRTLLTPVTLAAGKITDAVLDAVGRGTAEPLTREEYESYLNSCAGKGAFSSMESDFLKEVLEYSSKAVTEVMLPRARCGFLKKTDSPEQVESVIRKTRQLFIPVGTSMPDDADRILLAFRYFSLPPEKRENWSSSDCVRKALFLPETISVMPALRVLREKNALAALVSDEYGGIAGLVSRAGIYQRLTSAGNWNPRSTSSTSHSWVLDALMPLDAVAELTGWEVPEEIESNTLNGALCELIKTVPQKDSSVHAPGAELQVVELAGLRASRIRITLDPPGKEKNE